MYGLVNNALVALVRADCGEVACSKILADAGVGTSEFEATRPYPDEITTKIVVGASRAAGVPVSDYLRNFGRSWVPWLRQSDYSHYLRSGGTSLQEFLMNLDTMHAAAGVNFPELRPPSFKCEPSSANRLILHHFSSRSGLAPFVEGLLEGLAEHFGTAVSVDQIKESNGDGDHNVFQIRIQGSATSQRALDDMIGRTMSIQHRPEALQRVQEIIIDADTSVLDLADVIERDPALTTAVLRIANAPLYSTTPTTSLAQACVALGTRMLGEVVLTACLQAEFSAEPPTFSLLAFWDHSYRVALAARLMATAAESRSLDPEYAQTCGLLHHVGKLVMLQSSTEQFRGACTQSDKLALSLRDVLAGVYGFSDLDVLRCLAERWRLGEQLILSTRGWEHGDTGWEWAAVVEAAEELVDGTAWLTRSRGNAAVEALGIDADRLEWVVSRYDEKLNDL